MDMSLDEAVAAVAAVEKQEDQEEPEEDRAGSPLLVSFLEVATTAMPRRGVICMAGGRSSLQGSALLPSLAHGMLRCALRAATSTS